MDRERGDTPLLAKAYFSCNKENVKRANWLISRIAGQRGGFIRPAMFWRSFIPWEHRLAGSQDEVQELQSPGYLKRRARQAREQPVDPQAHIDPTEELLPWPRVIPSLAVKDTFLGLENMRVHPTCEQFFFKHSETKVTGLYRRNLWPEPWEDDLYAMLWHFSLVRTSPEWTAKNMPPIDDWKEAYSTVDITCGEGHVITTVEKQKTYTKANWKTHKKPLVRNTIPSITQALPTPPCMHLADRTRHYASRSGHPGSFQTLSQPWLCCLSRLRIDNGCFGAKRPLMPLWHLNHRDTRSFSKAWHICK